MIGIRSNWHKLLIQVVGIINFSLASIAVASSQTSYGNAPPPPVGIHPRIVLTPEELPALRLRVQSEPAKSAYEKCLVEGRKLQQLALSLPSISSDLQNRNDVPIGNLDKLTIPLECGALVVMTSGDAVLASDVRRVLVAYVRAVPTKLSDAAYLESAAIGLTYDWIYTELTESERDEIRKWLAARTWYFENMLDAQEFGFKPGSSKSRTYNWVTMYCGAFAMSALSIEGEEGYEARWYRKVSSSIRDFLEYGIGPEGAPVESIHYFAFGMQNGAAALDAMNRRGDLVFDDPHLRNIPLWWAYDLFPWGRDFNALQDTRDLHVGLAEIYLRLALAYPDDPVMQWVYANYEANNNGYAASPALAALWTTAPAETATAERLTLPLSRYFAKNGLAYMRSDWSDEATYLEIQDDPALAGPSHSHADRNSFTLASRGRQWVIDGGGWFPVDIGHNEVLIDGRGEGFFPMVGNPVAFNDARWAAAFTGDAKAAYDWRTDWPGAVGGKPVSGFTAFPYNPVQKAYRTAVLARGKHPYALITDDIRKDDLPHNYSFHMLTPFGNSVRSIGPGQVVLEPAYSGPLISHIGSNRCEPLKKPFTASAGSYKLWLLMGRDYWTPWNWWGQVSLDDRKPIKFLAREGDNAQVHWQLASDVVDGVKSVAISSGEHMLTLQCAAPIRYAAAALIPDSASPDLTGSANSLPEGSIRIELSKAGSSSAGAFGWSQIDAQEHPPRLIIRVLHPNTATIRAAVFPRRRADTGQDFGPVLAIDANVLAVEPAFQILLYPHRAGEIEPDIGVTNDSVTVVWPDKVTDKWIFGNGGSVIGERNGDGAVQRLRLMSQ
jgi:hypothetical protein